jgi:hypothetical protein
MLLITTRVVVSAPAPPPPPSPEPSSNCPDKCGDVHIPYPFGVGAGCSLNRMFALTCDNKTSPPSLLTGNVKVANITLETAQMVAYTYLTYSCNVPFGNGTSQLLRNSIALSVASPFLLSPSDNVFTALGCRSTAMLKGRSVDAYLTGCITTCERASDTGDDGAPCQGHGCCEASLTPGLTQVRMTWNEDEQGKYPVPDNPCQYAFVATKGWYVNYFFSFNYQIKNSVLYPFQIIEFYGFGAYSQFSAAQKFDVTLVEKGASIRHICLEPNSIRDQRVHQSRFI